MLKIISDLFIILILFRFILYFITKLIGWIGKFKVNTKANNYTKNHHKNNYHNKYNDQYNKNFNKNSVKDLIKCNYCGIYISSEESIKCNGKYFCCKEHVIN